MGERAHLASTDVGMETGIKDVLNIINYNDLKEFVLVGHSFAGKVTAAVADRLPEKVKKIIYLDGYSPDKVRTPQGVFPDEFPVVGSVVPFPVSFLDAVGRDVQGESRKWMTSKTTPTPIGYFRDPITLSANYDHLKRGYIYCTLGDTLEWILRQSPGKSTDEVLGSRLDGPFRVMETGHWPMITNPQELAENLANLLS
jgi:pimeloyl-ACP methyl ester carboxylesterase